MSDEWKEERVGESLVWEGREFQRVGADKEKERRAKEVLRLGMSRRLELEDLR